MGVLSGTPRVVLALGDAEGRDELLAIALVASGEDPHGVTLHHACRRCGSDEHGRPYLRRGSDALGLGLSLSRADEHLALGVVRGRDVGVDLEVEDAAAFTAYDEVVLHPQEASPETVEGRTRLWVRKEACLKLMGRGLELDPRSIRVDVGPTVDVEGAAVTLADLDLGDGLIAAVAVAGSTVPRVTVVRAAEGAPLP